MANCWFFWQHKWSKWMLGSFPVKSRVAGTWQEGIEEFQQRECLNCGLKQRRSLEP